VAEKEQKGGSISGGSFVGCPAYRVPINRVDAKGQKAFTKDPRRFASRKRFRRGLR
jgi:hypothetical protein